MASGTSTRVRLDGDGYRAVATARKHVVVADEPIELGGNDTGPNPYELLLASLGACTAITVRMYATRKGWSLQTIDVELTHARVYRRDCEDCGEGNPDERVDRIERRIRVQGQLTDEQRGRLLEIAGKCPVHKTLSHSSIIVDRLL